MYDEPGVKSVFALDPIEAPDGQMAISNMPAVETRELPARPEGRALRAVPKMTS